MHGIGWTPDQKEVWQSGQVGDPDIWNMQENQIELGEKTALPLQ